MHRKKDDGAQEQAEQAEQAEQEKTGAGHGAVRVAVCQGLGEQNQALDRGERLETAATSHKDEAFANESCIGRRTTEQAEQAEQEKTGAGHGAVRVAVCQGVGEQNQALDRGGRLEKAATSHKDEAFANESCIGRRMTEHKSRLSRLSRLSRRKRGRRQGVEDQRRTCKALSRSGAGSDMSGCVPGQLAPDRRPTNQAGAGGLRKSRFSRTCEREQKRTRSAGDGYGLISGDEEAVGTGCVLESAHFNLWEGAEGSVRGGMRTVFRYLNLSIYLGLKTAKRAHIRTDLNESN